MKTVKFLNKIKDHNKNHAIDIMINWLSFSLIPIYFVINGLFLMGFPVVHSDEIWLKGIACEMIGQKSFAITEPFFDLYPRVIHPFRWLYNLIIGSGLVIYDHVFIVRLVSLIASVFALIFFKKILEKLFKSPWMVLTGLLLMVLDIQFIYASHLGRQEMLILLLMLIGSYYLISHATSDVRYLALIILLSMGIHPNSFLIGLGFSGILFGKWLYDQESLVPLFKLIFYTSIGVLGYLLIGYLMSPHFLSGYFQYGSALGVDAPLDGRVTGFLWYWIKLYRQIGGTYDLFDIRHQLILLLGLTIYWFVLYIVSVFNKIKTRDFRAFIPMIWVISIALGLFIIGRYNQTAVIFMIPWLILMALLCLEMILEHQKKPSRITRRTSKIISVSIGVMLVITWGINSYGNFKSYERQHFYQNTYAEMIHTINEFVPNDAVVLANLNTLEAFNAHRFYDYRNLGYLDSHDDSFESYIEDRHIEYILVSDEMHYIHRTSPKWDFLYVNNRYYDDMMAFIEQRTIKVAEFDNPIYAMRIARFSGTYPWKTTIYKVQY